MTTNDSTTIVVDNITYCWHNDTGKYYYCDDIIDDVNESYQVTPGKIFKILKLNYRKKVFFPHPFNGQRHFSNPK